MSSGRAAVIHVGSANVDLVVRLPRLPGPGETVSGGVLERGHGGKGANRAVGSARLGASTALVGAVGDDDAGRELREELVRAGVDVDHLATAPLPTGTACVWVDPAGENCIAVAPGANGALTAPAVLQAVRALAGPASVVVADLEVPLEAVEAAAEAARAAGSAFVLNPAPARPLPSGLLRRCAVLVPNQHELDRLGAGSAADLLALGVGAVVVTRGAGGAELRRRGRPAWSQPALPVAVADSVGAGDAFVAALAVAMAEGLPLETAVRHGVAAGALATRTRGARAGLVSAAALAEAVARLPAGSQA